MPTPFEFWDAEFKTAYHAKEEMAMSSMALTEQVSGFIDQCFSKFGEDLAKGMLPDKVASGIEFYINYILRIIHIQVPDEVDALTEYSLGNMISTMKLVLHNLYNPATGVLLEDKEHFSQYIQADLQSFSSILFTRFVEHFPRLGDPVFAQLLQSTITDAVFVQASPLFQDVIAQQFRRRAEAA